MADSEDDEAETGGFILGLLAALFVKRGVKSGL